MLRQAGQNAILTRFYGPQRVPVSVELRVALVDFTEKEMADKSSLRAGDRKAILSTTEIDAAQWPGAVPDAQRQPGDPRVPRHGDTITLTKSGKVYTVQDGWEKPRLGEGDELVRMEATVR
jgi:hypothetical protein